MATNGFRSQYGRLIAWLCIILTLVLFMDLLDKLYYDQSILDNEIDLTGSILSQRLKRASEDYDDFSLFGDLPSKNASRVNQTVDDDAPGFDGLPVEQGFNDLVRGFFGIPGLGVFSGGLCLSFQLSKLVLAWVRDNYVRRYLPGMMITSNLTLDVYNASGRVNVSLGFINKASNTTCELFANHVETIYDDIDDYSL